MTVFSPRLCLAFTVLSCVLILNLMPVLAQQTPVLTDEVTGVSYTVETYSLANFPVGMVFASDGRLFYNEKTTGNVRMIDVEGKLQREPVISLPTDALQERGMLGLALDPAFDENSIMYVVHTRPGTARDYPANELVRFRLEEGIGVEPEVLLSVPITTGQLLHNGGNVHFGPDGFLYITFGDNGEAKNAQDLTNLLGKINRYQVTEEGLVPAPGNPFGADNPIFAYGLRNPFDFTFDSIEGNLFVAEVGHNCDDEINWIRRGFNYGWREGYECVGKNLVGGLPHPYQAPMLTFTPVETPTGLIVYDHPAITEWRGNLFFCNWNYGNLRRVVMNDDHTEVEEVYEIDLGGEQCRIDLVVGPEGGLYFGTVSEDSGAIMRLLPAEK